MNRLTFTSLVIALLFPASVELAASPAGAKLVQALRNREKYETIKAMLRPDVDYNYRDRDGFTPVLAAVYKRYPSIAETLLFRYGLPHTGRVPSYGDNNILHFIAETGQRGSLKHYKKITAHILAKGGVDVNHRNRSGYTPLMYGAAYGELWFVQALVRAGAKRGIKDNKGRTAADTARNAGNQLIAAWLDGQSLNAVRSSLTYMVKKNDIAGIRAYIAAGRDINITEPGSKRTALHYAVEKGARKIALLLIDAGINLNTRNKNGFTALNRACLHGQEEVVSRLIDRGADIRLRAHNSDLLCWMTGIGCLEGAVFAKSIPIIRKLARAGIDMNPRADAFGEPLVYLLLSNPGPEDLPLVRILLENGHRPGEKTIKILRTRIKNGCKVSRPFLELVLKYRKR